MSDDDRGTARRGTHVPAAARVRRQTPSSHDRTLYDEADADSEGVLGPAGRRAPRLVRAVAHGPASGTSRSRSGSSAAAERLLQLPRPPRRGRPRRPGRVPLGGRAGRHPHDHLRRAARRREPARQRAQGARRAARATGSTSTSAWSPSCRCRCSPAPASARRTRWCSAGSRPTRCATASTTPRRKVLVTGDGAWRRGKIVPLKETADAARRRDARRSSRCSCCGAPSSDVADDRRPRRLVARPRAAAVRRSARPSRWTPRTCSTCSTRRAPPAKPKGIMHTTGGYLTQVAFTHKYVFDLHPDTDVYWCAADVGWVTGHSYIVYGPLANRATSVHVRGHARPPRQGPALVDHREVRRDDPLHRAHRDPDVHEVGHASTPSATTCRRCACSARSASRSTPRRGSGTGSTSAASAAPSSTRGGRPRPAPS